MSNAGRRDFYGYYQFAQSAVQQAKVDDNGENGSYNASPASTHQAIKGNQVQADKRTN